MTHDALRRGSERSADTGSPPVRPQPVHPLLALQRSVGNAAVNELLAARVQRSPESEVQRDAADPTVAGAGGPKSYGISDGTISGQLTVAGQPATSAFIIMDGTSYFHATSS